MQTEKFDIQLLYGGATHSFFEMNEQEYATMAKEVHKKALEKAFSRGLPIYYSKNGVVIAEFADGKRFVVENSEFVKPYTENS
ncbi:MAG: hypothetical protein MUE30_08740 [Spirosomaceae bacterium]|jgi:hypothetical protein|nr:hypothetical protein [Spirosomataceae bacterium]